MRPHPTPMTTYETTVNVSTLPDPPPTDGAPPSPGWRRSTRCGPTNTCVEVARLGPRTIGVRDNVPVGTQGPGPALAFGLAEWRAFALRVRAGSGQADAGGEGPDRSA